MENASLTDRLRYCFDNILSKGTVGMVGLLALVSAFLILAISTFVYLVGIAPDEPGFAKVFWMSMMRTLDAGTMGGDTGGWPFLLSMLAVTLVGIVVVSILIGLITNGIEGRLKELRKGRSRVIEDGHIVILGWTEQLFDIILELIEANRNRTKSCIVILADEDKAKMEDSLQARFGKTGCTRIVCRTGNPMVMADLEIASIETARAIIILCPHAADPDADVIKMMLAIIKNPNRSRESHHIVAEIRDRKTIKVTEMVGQDEAELMVVDDIVAKIMAQTCCQSGLSLVYTELLNFSGDEIYFKHEPGLTGKTFGEALFSYETSTVIGICPAEGRPRLNPSMDARIGPGDRIIAISADIDTIHLSGKTAWGIETAAIRSHQPAAPKSDSILILGWNERAPIIINELDHYVAPGSKIAIVADFPQGESEISRRCTGLKNLTCTFQMGDTTDRELLDRLAIDKYRHVIVLCYSNTRDIQRADALTLITLLHLRDIADHSGHPFSIVSEMLDIRNRNLAEVTRPDDFILSDHIVSLLMAQVAKNKSLNTVFKDIFDPEGSEIYLKPVEDYVHVEGPQVNMYTVIEAARQRGEVAIGYRLHAKVNDAAEGHGIRLNPDKSALISFSHGDQVIVFAEK